MKPVSTKTHGVIDYVSVPLLLAAPRVFGWSPGVTRFLTAAAAGTFAYSLLTRYELGAKPVLPMTTHLALDALNGVTTMAAALLLGAANGSEKWAMLGLGGFELGAALTTQTEPSAVTVDATREPLDGDPPSPAEVRSSPAL